MQNFKLFLESDEDQPIRIKLNKPSNSITPKTFINIFNKEMNAQPIENRFYYEDGESIVIYSMKPFQDQVYVSDLTSDPRGFPAIRFLKQLTNLADQHQITLTCISQPLDVNNKVDPVRLTNLYKKFGFKPKSPNSDNLVRLPK